jgi:ribosomal protein S18 acetylase RimI-like enzyme
VLVIREARVEDAEGIARVHVDSWRWAYEGILPAGHLERLDVAARTTTWAERLGNPQARARTAVAELDGHVVGFVSWGRPWREDLGDQVGAIHAIYLKRRVQGRGVGRALLQHAVERLAATGFTEAKLWVLEANALARRFYERQGWSPDGATFVEEFDGEPLTELRYGRRLPVPGPS